MVTKVQLKFFKNAIILASLFYATIVSSQSIGTPTYAFTQICASPSFNSYSVNFTFTGFSGSNTFVLQMSDVNGSFVSPVNLNSVTTSVSPASISFSIPTTTAGQTYKLRIISGSVTSANTAPFAAYYQSFNNAFYINNQVSNVSICGTGSYTLAIDPASPGNPSPLSFSSLKYKWFRNNVVISGQTGTSISVTTAGTYRCEIDYGSCSTASSITKSQDVTVNIVTGGSTFTITPNGGTVCSSSPIVLSTTPGYNYQWFKDGNLITGATSYTLTITQPGTYKVQVNQGGCSSTSADVVFTASDFNFSIDALLVPKTNFISQGDTIIITATTDAASPSFEWYDPNNVLVSSTNTFSTSTPVDGEYKVICKQNSGCIFTKELRFKIAFGIKATVIPNVVSPNGDEKNDTWNIPDEYLNESTEIMIVKSTGELDFKTTNYQNNWPTKSIDFNAVNPIYYYVISKDGQPIKKGSITIIK